MTKLLDGLSPSVLARNLSNAVRSDKIVLWARKKAGYTRAPFDMADELRDNREWAQAASFYALGLKVQPTAAGYWVQYGNMLKEAGAFAEAEAAYFRALEYLPKDADLHLQLGKLKTKQGVIEEARAFYIKAVALGCTDPLAVEDVTASAISRLDVLDRENNGDYRHPFEIADDYRDNQEWATAAGYYALGLRIEPTASGYWVQFGNMLKEAGAFDESEVAYRYALEMIPEDADLHLQIGKLKIKQGATKLAKRFYIKAVALGCTDPLAVVHAPAEIILPAVATTLARMADTSGNPDHLEGVLLEAQMDGSSFARLVLIAAGDSHAN